MYLKANFRDPNASTSFSSNNVEASTLHTLLAEVRRRLQFEDREAVAIETNNNALSAITYQPEDKEDEEAAEADERTKNEAAYIAAIEFGIDMDRR